MEKGIDKSAQRALEAYPIVISQHSDNCKEYDSNESDRLTFIEGYEQAEKDLELGWEDIELIVNIDKDTDNEESIIGVRNNKEHYQEVLKRFKSYGKKKI